MLMIVPFMNSSDTRTKPTSVSFPDIKSLDLVPSSSNFNRIASPDQLKFKKLPPENIQHGRNVVPFVQNVMTENTGNLKNYRKSCRITSRKALINQQKPSSQESSKSIMTSIKQIPPAALQSISKSFIYLYHIWSRSHEKPIKDIGPKKPAIFIEICQILASTGIHYGDCDDTTLKEQEMLENSSTQWTNEDKNGIKWKQITEGSIYVCTTIFQEKILIFTYRER